MKAFLSHTTADRPLVERIQNDLANAGMDVWNFARIPAGASFLTEIMRQLRESDVVVFVLSDAAARSSFLQSEAAIVVANRMRGAKTRILPVFASPKAEIPFFVRDFVCLDLSTPEAYAKNISTLIDRATAPPDSDLAEPASMRAKEEYVKLTQSALQLEKVALVLETQRRSTQLRVSMGIATSLLTVIAVVASFLAVLADWNVVAWVATSLFAAIIASALSVSVATRALKRQDESMASIRCDLKKTLSSEDRASIGGPES